MATSRPGKRARLADGLADEAAIANKTDAKSSKGAEVEDDDREYHAEEDDQEEGEEQDDEESEEEIQLTIDEDGRAACTEGPPVDYSFQSFLALIRPDAEALATLRQDCEIAFTARAASSGAAYSRGETFWVSADALAPSTVLEGLALEIFRLHTQDKVFDATRSGAEWWTQVIDTEDEIGWHWDRDYGLEEEASIRLHPHLASVTYLTDGGAPTTVLEAIEPPEGDGGGASQPLRVTAAYLSRPRVGKHIAFDGRWLHAAPSELRGTLGILPQGSTELGCRRFTFLVNIWVNHKPLSASPFPNPATLSGASGAAGGLVPLPGAVATEVPRITCTPDDSLQQFKWHFCPEGGAPDGDEEGEEEEEDQDISDSVPLEGGGSPGVQGRRCISMALPAQKLREVEQSQDSVALLFLGNLCDVRPEALHMP